MKKLLGHSLAVVLTVASIFGLSGSAPALAATSPSLGDAASYGILSSTYVNTSASTRINGDVGFNTPPDTAPLGVHTNYGNGGPYASAVIAQNAALVSLNAINQPCTFTFDVGEVVLTTNVQHGSSTYTPGVYCIDGAVSVGAGITLNGAGTYIFRSTGALNAEGSSVVTISGGASACDVFWTPNGATTLNANSTFVGTVIPVSQPITLLDNVLWTGRALISSNTVTTGAVDTITVPTCTIPSSSVRRDSTINVVKAVINDNAGTKTVADFPLFINGTPVVSGATTNFPVPVGTYTVTETNDPGYTRTFSGDCDVSGQMNLNSGDNKFCIITNNDVGAPVAPVVPPLIDVVKVPSPLALPGGPGPVTYTYTVRNTGTVPMTNVTMVGDTCSPIVRVSGDTNGDSILQTNETWVHTCTTTLTATHTNTVVATGWANGISAVDIASATVVVGAPIVPPLIHVIKVPNPLALSAAGGAVTYTYTVTNPGTAPLSNVNITDDKCTGLPGRVVGHPGDLNHNDLLESNESWSFTCRSNLTATTTNTATASGTANGLTARDVAVATVVVAIPRLPSTGFPPENQNILLGVIVGVALLAGIPLALVIKRRMIES